MPSPVELLQTTRASFLPLGFVVVKSWTLPLAILSSSQTTQLHSQMLLEVLPKRLAFRTSYFNSVRELKMILQQLEPRIYKDSVSKMYREVAVKWLGFRPNYSGKQEKGFTLIEMLAVTIIIGIVAAIAAPNLLGLLNRNRLNQSIADVEGALK